MVTLPKPAELQPGSALHRAMVGTATTWSQRAWHPLYVGVEFTLPREPRSPLSAHVAQNFMSPHELVALPLADRSAPSGRLHVAALAELRVATVPDGTIAWFWATALRTFCLRSNRAGTTAFCFKCGVWSPNPAPPRPSPAPRSPAHQASSPAPLSPRSLRQRRLARLAGEGVVCARQDDNGGSDSTAVAANASGGDGDGNVNNVSAGAARNTRGAGAAASATVVTGADGECSRCALGCGFAASGTLGLCSSCEHDACTCASAQVDATNGPHQFGDSRADGSRCGGIGDSEFDPSSSWFALQLPSIVRRTRDLLSRPLASRLPTSQVTLIRSGIHDLLRWRRTGTDPGKDNDDAACAALQAVTGAVVQLGELLQRMEACDSVLVIAQPPALRTVDMHCSVSLVIQAWVPDLVAANASTQLSFEWCKDGAPLGTSCAATEQVNVAGPGVGVAATATLVLRSCTARETGAYHCIVRALAGGSVVSSKETIPTEVRFSDAFAALVRQKQEVEAAVAAASAAKQWARVEEECSRALDLDPEDDAYCSRILVRRAAAALAAGTAVSRGALQRHWRRALHFACDACTRAPSSRAAHLVRAAAASTAGRYSEHVEALDMAQRCSACPSDVDGVMWPKLPDSCVCNDDTHLRKQFMAARAALEQRQREAASDAERAAAERFMRMHARGAFLRRVRAWQAEWAESARQQQTQHQRTQGQAGHDDMPMPRSHGHEQRRYPHGEEHHGYHREREQEQHRHQRQRQRHRQRPCSETETASHAELYAILGLPLGASRTQIRQAYRAGALRLHPDKGGTHEDFVRLQHAYEVLLAVHEKCYPHEA